MGSLSHNLKLAGLLLNITEWDRHLEVVRQILNGINAFEPYEAFLRIQRGRKSGHSGAISGITSREIENFMRDNALPVDLNALEVVVKIYDTKLQGYLDFEDFLKMTLTRDNPSVRFDAAANRQIRDIQDDEVLAEEVEYCLARLFSKAIDFVRRMKIDAESQSILGEKDLFNKLLSASGSTGSNLDFKVLKRFFEQLKIVPKDSEIIAILRIIDINDDGVIDKTEFDYFLGLFNLQGPDVSLLYRLKDRNQKENEYNYFGEKKANSGTATLNSTAKVERGRERYGTSTRSNASSTNGGYQSRLNPSVEKSPVFRNPATDLQPGASNIGSQQRNLGFSSTSKDHYTTSYKAANHRDTEANVLSSVHPNATYHYEKTTYSEVKGTTPEHLPSHGRGHTYRPLRSPNQKTSVEASADPHTQTSSKYGREIAELRMLGVNHPNGSIDLHSTQGSKTLHHERSTPKRTASPPRGTGTPVHSRIVVSPNKENSATPSKRQRTEYTRLASYTGLAQPKDKEPLSRTGDLIPKSTSFSSAAYAHHNSVHKEDFAGFTNNPHLQKSSSPSFRAYDPPKSSLHSGESIRNTTLYKEIKLT